MFFARKICKFKIIMLYQIKIIFEKKMVEYAYTCIIMHKAFLKMIAMQRKVSFQFYFLSSKNLFKNFACDIIKLDFKVY